jgi:serpin B
VDSPIDPLVMMYLINAIYFKGAWTYRFDSGDTRDMEFELSDGSTKDVPMMIMEDVHFPIYRGEGFQAVELAYGDSLYAMTIILPYSSTDIDLLISELDGEMWSTITGNYYREELATFGMPKFKLEYEILLNDVLKALGMEVAFDDALADFTRMYYADGQPNLFISRVKHRTFVEVNEEGTEAAAVTAVEMAFTSLPGSLIIDRPFIFAIRERCSGTIIFIGKIVDPEP